VLIEIWTPILGASTSFLTEVTLKKYRVFISTLILLVVASPSCAQTGKKKKEAEALLSAAIPQPLWTYDTGG
jgi:hypothetical protein